MTAVVQAAAAVAAVATATVQAVTQALEYGMSAAADHLPQLQPAAQLQAAGTQPWPVVQATQGTQSTTQSVAVSSPVVGRPAPLPQTHAVDAAGSPGAFAQPLAAGMAGAPSQQGYAGTATAAQLVPPQPTPAPSPLPPPQPQQPQPHGTAAPAAAAQVWPAVQHVNTSAWCPR